MYLGKNKEHWLKNLYRVDYNIRCFLEYFNWSTDLKNRKF